MVDFFISLLTKEGETATKQDLYHILMSSTFFVAVDRFHDYVFPCLCQTDQEQHQEYISKHNNIKPETKERSRRFLNWKLLMAIDTISNVSFE